MVIDNEPWLQLEQHFRSRAVIIGIWGDQCRSLVDAVKYHRSTIRFDLRVRKNLVETLARIKNPVRAIELQSSILQQKTLKTFAKSTLERFVMPSHCLSGKTVLETYSKHPKRKKIRSPLQILYEM